jgi:steroid delta-isomerase-like uncharacterized protein
VHDQTVAETLRLHLEAEAAHDAQAAAACYLDDGWYEHLALGLRFDGREMIAAQYAASYEAMPDLAFVVADEFVSETRALQTGTITGTVSGPLAGLDPTGASVSVPMMATYGFRDGLIEHERVLFDLATFAEQAQLDINQLRAALGHHDPAAVASATVRRYADAKSHTDVDAALAECTDDFVLNTIPFRATAHGVDEARHQLRLFFEVFPDYAVTLGGEVASAGVVTCWGTVSATMHGDLGPIVATGRRFALPFMCAFPMRGAKIAGEDFYFDLAMMSAQLDIDLAEIHELLPTPALVS